MLPSIPVAHAFGIKESDYSSVLQHIKYYPYKWNICADLKVIALLLGLQFGYTKFPCFLCEWDSKDKAHHYVKRIWPARKILEQGHKNVKHHSLDESSRILLPPLHNKLGLMKNFVKAMDHNGTHFCTCDKNSPCLVMPRYKRMFSPVQTFAHFFMMRYMNTSLQVMRKEHGMPFKRWLQAS